MIVVFLTQRNADMTEGRGPMINDRCFSSRKAAADYIDEQEGVMGWSSRKFGDWMIVPLDVIDVWDAQAEKKKIALNKLTDEEKRILGLNS